jgi:hypothetical protein
MEKLKHPKGPKPASSAGTLADLTQAHLRRIQRICSSLPDATERLSHGEPTFFAGKRVFAMFSNNHHNDGHVAVLIPAAPGVQEALIASAPRKFYRPPYVGVRGWVGVELDEVKDDELGQYLTEAWQLIARSGKSKRQTKHG